MQRCEIELDLPPERALAALAAAAGEWQGEFEPEGAAGGRLYLPVLFGLRRGLAIGRVEAVRLGDERARLIWTLEESHLEIHTSSVVVLSIAAVPLVATVAWPFHPPLMALLPFAAVAGLSAWWLVVSRLRSRGPHEFFAELGGSGTALRAGARESPREPIG